MALSLKAERFCQNKQYKTKSSGSKHWMQGFTFAASGSVQRASQVYEKSANRPAPAGLGSWDFYSKHWMQGFTFAASGSVQRASQVYGKPAGQLRPKRACFPGFSQ